MSVTHSVIWAMTPVVVVFLIGYLAAKIHDFGDSESEALNKLVMKYALPMTLFVGTVETSKATILSDMTLTFSFVFIFAGLYFLLLFLFRYLLKMKIAMAAITALTATVPGVSFIGPSVLNVFFGADSGIMVSISSLVINVVTLPATIIFMTIGSDEKKDKSVNSVRLLQKQIGSAVSAPVVWMPVLGLVFVLAGVEIPSLIDSSLSLLAISTGGVSLFASGIVLASYPIKINKFVTFTVVMKNIIQPAILWGGLLLLGVNTPVINEAVVTTAIPSVSLAVMLAMRFKMEQSDTASAAFFSTVFSIVTMGLFVWLLGV